MCDNVKTFATPLHELCKKVKYKSMYRTPEDKTSGYPTKINNIDDAFYSLKDFIQRSDYMESNQTRYATKTKLGEMHIYEDDRPLEYISAV